MFLTAFFLRGDVSRQSFDLCWTPLIRDSTQNKLKRGASFEIIPEFSLQFIGFHADTVSIKLLTGLVSIPSIALNNVERIHNEKFALRAAIALPM
jgi:hypothetical protein